VWKSGTENRTREIRTKKTQLDREIFEKMNQSDIEYERINQDTTKKLDIITNENWKSDRQRLKKSDKWNWDGRNLTDHN